MSASENVSNMMTAEDASKRPVVAATIGAMGETGPIIAANAHGIIEESNREDNIVGDTVVEDEKNAKGSGSSTNNNKNANYLMAELIAEINDNMPSDGDFDTSMGQMTDSGLHQLQDICNKLFWKQREFDNVYQLQQFASHFAGYWYFEVSRNGYSLCCHFAAPSKKE